MIRTGLPRQQDRGGRVTGTVIDQDGVFRSAGQGSLDRTTQVFRSAGEGGEREAESEAERERAKLGLRGG